MLLPRALPILSASRNTAPSAPALAVTVSSGSRATAHSHSSGRSRGGRRPGGTSAEYLQSTGCVARTTFIQYYSSLL